MSIKTWLEEIHGGKTIPEKTSSEDVLFALDYAIETYSNLGEAMRGKHGIHWELNPVSAWWSLVDSEGGSYNFNTTNCWLCHIFFSLSFCPDCPLTLVGKRCIRIETMSPWGFVIKRRNPKPLLRALKEARKLMLEGAKEA
jgi:hypothetical protein